MDHGWLTASPRACCQGSPHASQRAFPSFPKLSPASPQHLPKLSRSRSSPQALPKLSRSSPAQNSPQPLPTPDSRSRLCPGLVCPSICPELPNRSRNPRRPAQNHSSPSAETFERMRDCWQEQSYSPATPHLYSLHGPPEAYPHQHRAPNLELLGKFLQERLKLMALTFKPETLKPETPTPKPFDFRLQEQASEVRLGPGSMPRT